MKGSTITIAGSGEEPLSDSQWLVEVLYESATTRVFRGGHSPTWVIFKETLGADAAQRLRHEKDMLARLAGLEGVVQLAPEAYRAQLLALRDCSGTALAQVLRAGRCEAARVVPLALQLTQALAAVHRAGVIHRDINPANIVLSEAGDPVLIDFDLAVLAEQHLAVAQDGQIVGTLGYLAPEQTGRTGRAVDQRADLYALGATLYEMATGRPPFEGADTLQLIHDHLVREPVAPSQVDARVPRGLSRIILRLLAKAPEQRYQSAEGLLHDLVRLRKELELGRDSVFTLGERDFPARLAPPARLVGRDTELALLQTAFNSALNSTRRALLIEGAAGVGKSALINELRPMVAAAGGWFVRGKFDQYQKEGATAEALTQATRALGRLLLAQPPDALVAQRQRILERLGRRGGVITRASPEFELLLGTQPEVPEVDPRQAELQLQQATVDLLGAIASPQRPLVIVLDDLQWAGALSLRAFTRLMGEAKLRGLLLVGAYRGEEIDEHHVLAPILAQWRQQPEPPGQIALASLTSAGMGELVGQILRLAPEPAGELALAVGALTGGNPFDTVEMINALRREGVLSLREPGWHWEEAAIRHFVSRGNVVDLLAARIGRLPVASRELLEFMSCLGNAVDCELLGAAAGLSDGELGERLRAPLDDGLLLADATSGQESVRFRHDRVQQAVLSTMGNAQRGDHQLAMARRLAGEPAFEREAAQQYLSCVPALQALGDAQEQRRAALLFHGLARKLASTATYLLAERYLSAAGTLLAARGDPADAPMRGLVDLARHAALYSLGRLDESDPLYAALEASHHEPLDLLESTCLQMRSLDMRGRMDEAKALGLHMLARLGVQVPQDFATPDIEQRLDALGDWIRQDSLQEQATRRQMLDKQALAISKLLGRTVRSSLIRYDVKAIVWLLLEGQRLWTLHGPCAELVACLGRMASVLVTLRGDYRTGYEIARHMLTVGEALGYEPQTSEARFIFGTYAGHWFEPVEDILEQLTRAYQGVQTGADIPYAGYVHILLVTALLEVAPTVDASAVEVDAGIALCQSSGNMHAAVQHMSERQMLRALRGLTKAPDSFDDAQFSEEQFLARFGKLPYLTHTFCECRALHALVMGDAQTLATNARLGKSLAGSLAGYYMTVFAAFLSAMGCARQLQLGPDIADRQALLAELESCRDWLASRAADQPHNYLHLLRLVEAESAWALGDFWSAATAFDAAVLEAESTQRPWHRALIVERAGLFHLARGLMRSGRELLAQAASLYQAWGASAKVARMRLEHDFLRTLSLTLDSPAQAPDLHASVSSRSVAAEAVDLIGILRASQALSSETTLESLTTRVTEVLAALAGATKVCVLSWDEQQWWLLAPAPGQPPLPLATAAEQGLLPLSAFGYAERTQEPLLVDDAARDERFARDPYFAQGGDCSLLLVPIASQGAARAMLYLENRLGRAAFNAQRLDAVMLIAGQLAVSLVNAQLYESLEDRVHARTEELRETQAQLVATARRAGKAEIANNVLHNVGNFLNSINVSASVVRRGLHESRSGGLARAVALMKQHQDDLAAFIGTDPRGSALIPYLDRLAQALEAERRDALDELDRLRRSVDHISYVVATQQSNAGPSTVLETARPQDVLEEALRLSADALARYGADVVRLYEDVPAVALDSQRLLQILVNLIVNAAQAMESAPRQERRITLGIEAVREGGRDHLRITVQDAGEGISPPNLERIFSHGFTTRKGGHGFGLHSSALAAVEMGGKLATHSGGKGQGATFTLQVPVGPGT